MGLLDGIIGNVVGSVLGGGRTAPGGNALSSVLGKLAGGAVAQKGPQLLAVAMAMLQQHGGLNGVLEKFRSSGLAAQADSWVSTGANLPVSDEQVKDVLGASTLGGIASQLGISQGQAASTIAQLLPELVNQLTPHGSVPDDDQDLLSKGLAMLRGGGA